MQPVTKIWTFVLLFFFGALGSSCANEGSTNTSTEMDSGQALRLVDEWSRHAKENMKTLSVRPDGSFYGQIGAPFVEYVSNKHVLIVRGIVDTEGEDVLGIPRLMKKIKEAESKDGRTLAGGAFEVDTGSHLLGKKPSLNIRKDFTDPSIDPRQFTNAVDALMEAATWWRKIRLLEIMATVE